MKSSRSILRVLHSLLESLPRPRRVQLVLLVGLMFLGALAELVSIGAVVPFLAILTDAERALQQPSMARLITFLGLSGAQDARWQLTLMFALAAVASGAIRLTLLYSVAKFNFGIAHDLSSEVYRRTLYQPYSAHLARNSSEVIGSITKVDAVAGVVYGLLTGCGAALMAAFIVAALLLIDPLIASISLLGFGTIYMVVSLLTRKRLAINSCVNSSAFNARLQALQEGLGGIRDVLLDHAQPVFSRRFNDIDQAFRQSQASTYFIGPSPRFAVEAVGMALIALLAFALVDSGGGIGTAIPVLGGLALGAQRLMPLLQQMYQGWVVLAGNRQALEDVLEMVRQPLPPVLTGTAEALPFEHDIRLVGVSFRYQPQLPPVLQELNLTITKGARIGLVGATGSGKSTAMDLVMGLISPSTGEILVDGRPLVGASKLSWQKNIAHVPQSIFLADSSFAENIAFGVPREEIDLDLVRRAAERAQIADFIEATRDGYDTPVGERGTRLSGGQRQRIGIARAFYKEAKVLVFDEATSALDVETENAVMDAIRSFDRSLTVLIIAHRLKTLQGCDRIYRIDNGNIVFSGNYSQMMAL